MKSHRIVQLSEAGYLFIFSILKHFGSLELGLKNEKYFITTEDIHNQGSQWSVGNRFFRSQVEMSHTHNLIQPMI